jgi:hypothetical protein
LSKEVQREMKIVNKKEKEMLFWKTAFDRKKEKSEEKNKSMNFRKIFLK